MQNMSAVVRSLDHLVLTVADIGRTVDFYTQLGMRAETFGAEGRTALTFGSQKINLHAVDRTFEPKARVPTPGSADLCFLVDNVDAMLEQLKSADISVIDGPVERTGATGPVRSIYVRDPDGNLVELSEPILP